MGANKHDVGSIYTDMHVEEGDFILKIRQR